MRINHYNQDQKLTSSHHITSTDVSYSFVSPDFAYSLRCPLCRHEVAHSKQQHDALCNSAVADFTKGDN